MAKKICLYSVLTSLCIVFGYIEHIISFDFIAPGIKIGLANTVALLLIAIGDKKGAFCVNIVRILISALLFSAPSTLIYSLSGGIVAFAIMCLFTRLKSVGVIGISTVGAIAHNITQYICAFWLLGRGIVYYLPILLLAGVFAGIVTGVIVSIVIKKFKKINIKFSSI